jgi:hypothetical protein
VHDPQTRPRDLELAAFFDRVVGLALRVDDVPEHLVGRVEPDRRTTRGPRQRVCRVDVVVVAVRAQDRGDLPVADGCENRRRVVRGIDDEHLVVVADQPDVVLDLEVFTVDREDPGRRHVLDPWSRHVGH